jgi:hypothetical protein
MPRPLFFELTPESWEIAKQIGRRLNPYSFRGQAEKKWGLETSIERAAKQFIAPAGTIWEQEKRILYEFKSRAHYLIQSPPDEGDSLEWLALLQHYGGVTRLLDFTRSFYIASFFCNGKRNRRCKYLGNFHYLPYYKYDKGPQD